MEGGQKGETWSFDEVTGAAGKPRCAGVQGTEDVARDILFLDACATHSTPPASPIVRHASCSSRTTRRSLRDTLATAAELPARPREGRGSRRKRLPAFVGDSVSHGVTEERRSTAPALRTRQRAAPL